MTRALVDTAVFVHAVGADHPLRAPCRQIVRSLRERTLVLEASVELVHEYAHVRLRRLGDRGRAVAEARAIRRLVTLHPVELGDLDRALAVLADAPIGGRDAVHAATALERGIGVIVTPDTAFDHVPGLHRLDPSAALTDLAR